MQLDQTNHVFQKNHVLQVYYIIKLLRGCPAIEVGPNCHHKSSDFS